MPGILKTNAPYWRKYKNSKRVVGLLLVVMLLFSFYMPYGEGGILKAGDYKHYVDSFNRNDNELYPQYIPNADSWKFLQENIPLFDCPDKMMEQTWYFRWWTFRKHIKQTPEGFIVTEFLPKVPWSGKYNSINCPAGHHFYEGRWLNDRRYLRDYAKFWLMGGGAPRVYSFWVADALLKYYEVSGDSALLRELFDPLVANYEAWEKTNLDENGLFWQVDGNDGMEVSICGALSEGAKGYRATINTYMFADAKAIAAIATMLNNKEDAEKFAARANRIKQNVQTILWDDGASFFKVLPKGATGLCAARELHGYTPWYSNMPDAKYSVAWKYLMDLTYFFAPYGPTTAERNHPGFKISYEGHECQWNGPGWPYATSITLTAAANLLNHYRQNYFSKQDYLQLLQGYTNSHSRTMPNGKKLPWIDENLNPFTGDWISRTRLEKWNNGSWSDEKGGVERGKDYNHSTYCDLIISGLIGVRPQQDDTLIINPLVPVDAWEYFCLDNLSYRGKKLTVLYDRTGKRYRQGKGFMVFLNGKKISSAPTISKLKIKV